MALGYNNSVSKVTGLDSWALISGTISKMALSMLFGVARVWSWSLSTVQCRG